MAVAFVGGYVILVGIVGIIFLTIELFRWRSKKIQRVLRHNNDLKKAIELINSNLEDFRIGDYVSLWMSDNTYAYYQIESILFGEIFDDHNIVRIKTMPKLNAKLIGYNVSWLRNAKTGIVEDLVSFVERSEISGRPESRNFFEYMPSAAGAKSHEIIKFYKVKKVDENKKIVAIESRPTSPEQIAYIKEKGIAKAHILNKLEDHSYTRIEMLRLIDSDAFSLEVLRDFNEITEEIYQCADRRKALKEFIEHIRNYILPFDDVENVVIARDATNNEPEFDNMEGHVFEEYCAKLLIKNRFTNIQVTSGSGDQGIDILANKDGIKYGIQCKRYASDVGNGAIQEAYSGKTYYGCHVGVVLTNRYFTRSAIDLAERNGILLWDRNKLLELIENAKK